MSRLQSQWQRLYLPPAAGESADAATLVDTSGQVRALVIELARPADWDVLSVVWRGVQADLEWPAPAIAVSGTEGLQLWLSLAEPVSVSSAAGLLARLRARYLPEVAPARVRLFPSAAEPSRHAARVPAEQGDTGNWSAFVAPDLAPVFADTPWLDIPPNLEGQADLLARLQSITPAAFEAAMAQLQPAVPPSASPAAATPQAGGAPDVDPQRFLQQVLNDETAPLALRVDAARALLGHTARRA